MRKISKKGKLALLILFFFLSIPLGVFYTLEGTGFFDTRSEADAPGPLPPRLKFADLNADNVIDLSDFGIWLKDLRAFKKNVSAYNVRSDFNDDKSITLVDFGIWLPAFREYKTIKDIRRPTVVTLNATGECRDFILSGDLVDDGGGEITVRGFLYSKNPNPVLKDVGQGVERVIKNEGDYKVSLGTNKLDASTKYYYRTFARNVVGVSYGEVKNFTTDVPVASTKDFELLPDLVAVKLLGYVHACGKGIEDSGFVFSKEVRSKEDLKRGADGVREILREGTWGAGDFSLEIPKISLTLGTRYWYRTYMKNRQGEEVYGEVDTFVTKNAYVDTLSAENIVEYRAKLRGRAVASEASLISSRGFLYAITPPLINECNPNVMIVGGANTRIPVAGARGFYEYHFPAGGLPAKGRTYCYRSYIELSGKPPTYEYGDMMTFRTLDLAEIKPLAADKIGKVGARVRGEYISSTSPVNRIGFVFSKTEENDNPFLSGEYVTIVNFCVNKTHCEKRMGPPPDGLDIINGGVVYRGIYSLLQPDTGYSFRMFVDNDDGRALTPVRRFRTLK